MISPILKLIILFLYVIAGSLVLVALSAVIAVFAIIIIEMVKGLYKWIKERRKADNS